MKITNWTKWTTAGRWLKLPAHGSVKMPSKSHAEQAAAALNACKGLDADAIGPCLHSLAEVTDILGRIFRGEPVGGEVLDAIDMARANLRAVHAREPVASEAPGT